MKKIISKKKKKYKKKEKRQVSINKKGGKESLWITIVIHSDLGVGESLFPCTI
jgi:hypothetical protein